MKSIQILSAIMGLTASAAAYVAPRADRVFCPVTASEEFKAAAEEMMIAESNNASLRVAAAAATITVPVWFHVVAASTSEADGYVSQTQLDEQFAVMNENFAPYGIAFTLAGTDYTINRNWASDGNELAMKRALRQGDYATLNIYFQKALYQDAFGYAYLPTRVTSGSTSFYYDGLSIKSSTVPGGSETGYNQGKTVTHEAGHWFGLLHTFEGYSCTGSGDSVADTPQESTATSGCPSSKDSCPGVAGSDPIHNYMDYSTDPCYTEFSTGQQTRMVNMYNTYRA